MRKIYLLGSKTSRRRCDRWCAPFNLARYSLLAALLTTVGLCAIGQATWARDRQQRAEATCDLAAEQAALQTGVPISVLKAITRAETGRSKHGTLKPWPWTVNVEGEGRWFDTQSAAMAYVKGRHRDGARSYDVGCFQINYKWHGQHFASLEEMFDPMENAYYAAFFLSKLYQEFGSWSKAAGAYHSRTPKFAERYTKRFERIHASIGATATRQPTLIARRLRPTETDRHRSIENTFPLLRRGEPNSQNRGSLFPKQSDANHALIGFLDGTANANH